LELFILNVKNGTPVVDKTFKWDLNTMSPGEVLMMGLSFSYSASRCDLVEAEKKLAPYYRAPSKTDAKTVEQILAPLRQ
jgi:hypothetical protein